MIHDDLPCQRAREQISARSDGELQDERALEAHLARCDACREHARALADLRHDFAALRGLPVPTDLWPQLEARARRVSVVRPLRAPARVAAALLGFLGLGGGLLWLERDAARTPPSRHLLERLAHKTEPGGLFAAVPEYRLLRALSAETLPPERSR